MLLQRGANANASDNDGHTPLHLAIMEGNLEIVAELVAAGAMGDQKTEAGLTALDMAICIDDPGIISLLTTAEDRTR
jgi:ankyrin repeat protein